MSCVDKNAVHSCSFCGKESSDAVVVISAPDGAAICEECVATCAGAIMAQLDVSLAMDNDGTMVWETSDEAGKDRGKRATRPPKKASFAERKGIPSPREIFNRLSEYVVGQEEAKTTLSVAVYNHYMRSLVGRSDCDSGVELSKSNVLLLGPTGSGKTLLAQTLARTMQVPFAIADATTLTEAGYVGEDVESILRALLEAADNDVKRAEHGIVYIDEIDKIACGSPGGSRTRDVSGEGVQQGLLKILEGTVASVPMQAGPKSHEARTVRIDTSNILFILGGAFPGLSDIVSKRLNRPVVGFGSQIGNRDCAGDATLMAQVVPDDLSAFGMLPEMVGRVPVITSLAALSETDLIRIQTEPKNAVAKQFATQLALEDCKLTITDGAMLAIAREASERGTGARGLRSIYERVLRKAMFDLPDQVVSTEVTLRESDVLGESFPEIRGRRESGARNRGPAAPAVTG